MYPWNDPSGRFSLFKLCVFILLFVPACFILPPVFLHHGATPSVKDAIHGSGDWAIRMLVISLAITPIRRILRWSRLIQVRRQIGLAALGYGLLHVGLYCVSLSWDVPRIMTEICVRIYLTIGFAAVFGLIVLGVTSNKISMKKLGKNWGRLHRLTYFIAVLACLHFFMQSKIDVSEAVLMSGIFVGLMGYRLAYRLNLSIRSFFILFVVAILAGVLSAAIEYIWYEVASNLPAYRIFLANLSFNWPLRPAWNVASFGLGVALVSFFGKDKAALVYFLEKKDRLFRIIARRRAKT